MAAVECVDLLYELTFAFVHNYASDFNFLRKLIDEEIIPKLPLSWRRLAFFKVIKLLKEDPKGNGHSLHLVRFMQYIVAPLFAYAFEMYDIDSVVGGPPPEMAETEQQHQEQQQQVDEQQQQNIVSVLCKDVIQRLTNDRSLMSHTLTIVMYLFCSLLVQKCSMHIYDPQKKQQQGNRQEQGNLRHFMLFGWPCLQQSFRGDMTEKYAGHFLIANIIDQFSINRTIILQVLNSLMQAHTHDNREMIRKSLDILIPAVPRRMADGHAQLQILFKKVMTEECRNSPQLIHCLQFIIRHHKVFYHIRHQLAQLILSSIQRLLSMQSGYDIKRLVLEMCEVIIKWEQERLTALTAAESTTGEEGDGSSTGDMAEKPHSSAVPDVPMQPASADLHKQMDKQFIDNVIIVLFRMATSTESAATSTAMEQINRRAAFMLRTALKPTVFGAVATIRTQLLEKQLQLPNPEQFSAGNEAAINHQLQIVNVTLDVLSNLIPHLAPQTVVDLFRPLQRSLICCMGYNNSQQILRNTYNILTRLLEKTRSSATGLDEFESLNQHIARSIHDAFDHYATALTTSPPMTIITLMRLMHSLQPAYLDTVCLKPFVKLLQRLVREYVVVSPQASSSIDQAQKLIGDLLSICLEVLCSRTKHFSSNNEETKQNVVQFILVPLIEKNAMDKIVENIIKISLEIVHAELLQNRADIELFNAANATQQQQSEVQLQPSEGAQVLIKLFTAMDQRLAANAELRRHFLNAILVLYENPELLYGLNMANRLQQAFYWGLSSADRDIRNRFFAVFERQFTKDIVARLVHVLSKEDWRMMGTYFWLPHVVHLLLLSADAERRIWLNNSAVFANIVETTPGRAVEDVQEPMEEGGQPEEEDPMEIEQRQKGMEAVDAPAQQVLAVQLGEDPMEQEQQQLQLPQQSSLATPRTIGSRETSMMRISFSELASTATPEESSSPTKRSPLERNLAEIQNNLVLLTRSEANVGKLVGNLMEIVHFNSAICHKIFVELFSSLWPTFGTEDREEVTAFVKPFLASAEPMMPHRDSQQPSVIASFLEAFLKCQPPIQLDPFILYYVGSNHRCWHLALLQLEKLAKPIKLTGDPSLLSASNYPREKLDTLECLAQLYQQLNELDQHVFVWKKRAYFEKTVKCMTFYQQGDFVRARETAEKLMAILADKIAKTAPADVHQFTTPAINAEMKAFERCWINSCKQLNDWGALEFYAGSEDVADPSLLADALWHLNDWKVLKECLVQLDAAGDPQTHVKSTLMKLMMSTANFDQQEHRPSKEFTEKAVLEINRALIREWRRLPPIVSHSHSELLNHTHVTHEVYESAMLLSNNLHSVNFPSSNGGSNGLGQDLKKLIKAWSNRNRSTHFVDQSPSWYEQFTWRTQFFSSLLRFYESTDQKAAISLPLHAITQNQLEFTRALRHSNQIDLALAEMNKLHSSTAVLPMDVHSKLVEHVKCLLKLSSGDATCTSRKLTPQDALVEALDLVEGTQFKLLRREQIGRLMVCKGILLNRLDKREEAGKAFSVAAQLDHQQSPDQQGPGASVWKHWGDFLTSIFLPNNNEISALNTGVQTLSCTLEHARLVGPQKARAPIAKLLWLLKVMASIGSEKVSAAVDELIEQYVEEIPAANWIFWLNALVADLKQRGSQSMLNVLKMLGRAYPQQVFCALRLELGPERVTKSIGKYKDRRPLLQAPPDDGEQYLEMYPEEQGSSTGQLLSLLASICAHSLVNVDALDRVLNELDQFPIAPIEALLNDFKQILAQCHFEQFTKVTELSTICAEPELLQRLGQSIHAFCANSGKDMEQLSSHLSEQFSPLLQQSNKAPSLHRLTSALRRWIPLLCHQLRSRLGPGGQSCQLRLAEVSPFLARFKSSMAQLDVFDGGRQLAGHGCSAQLSQFLPHYEEHVKNESVCRLLRVRSLNGKIYSYQLERVRHEHAGQSLHILQLFALLNAEFVKSRNTAQRHVQFAIPQMLFTGTNARLVECCPLAGCSSQYQNANSDSAGDNFVVFIDILAEMLNKERAAAAGGGVGAVQQQATSPLAIVECYYNRLAEQRYSHKTIHELFNQISAPPADVSACTQQRSSTQTVLQVKRDLLARWMRQRYPDPGTLWTVRKKMAVQFALLGLSEHTFFLSSMTPDGLVLDVSTGQLFFTDYKFDLTKKACETLAGKVQFIELDANRPVPFRLTSNITNFLDCSIEGHLSGAMTAVARSFSTRSLEVWLRPILWDVFSRAAEEDHTQMNVMNPVKRAIDTILNRIKLISHFENGVGATSQLLMQAQLPDNLCRMDPGFHPWF